MSTARAVRAGILWRSGFEGGVPRRLELGLERGVVGQPAAQRPLPNAAAGGGLPDRRLGQERHDRLRAYGPGLGAVAGPVFPAICTTTENGRSVTLKNSPCAPHPAARLVPGSLVGPECLGVPGALEVPGGPSD